MARRILICGDRDWTDRTSIEIQLRAIITPGAGDILIHGTARGADTFGSQFPDILQRMAFAERHALDIGFGEVLPFIPEWESHGRGAGHIRNQRMLTEGKPDRAFAFHSNIEQSKGTKDMVRRLRGAGIPVDIIT